jgi:hypothetical protein
MSERWKYQIKYGGIWGVFMTVFNVLFELKEKPIGVQITSQNFYIRAVAFILIGIFVLAYFNWKQKVKNESNH